MPQNPRKPGSPAKNAIRGLRRRQVNLRVLPGGKYGKKKVIRVPREEPVSKGAPPEKKISRIPRIPLGALAAARIKRTKRIKINPFDLEAYKALLTPHPSVPKERHIAMDQGVTSSMHWAGGVFNALESAEEEGLAWLGFAYLSLLAQRPEYRRFAEVLAGEMTRKWIKIEAKGDEDKTEKIDQLNDEFGRLEVQKIFRKMAYGDNLFGRMHLYIALEINGKEVIDDREELTTDIGDGKNTASVNKVVRGSLKGLRAVEPIWTYPQYYNSFDPLRTDYYKPTSWFVQGKEVHQSRILTFIGREVPDILKPVYQFGGLSMSQMAKPYVDNWLRTRQSVTDLISAFSVFTLKTDLGESLSLGGDELFKRIELFNSLRDNQGLMALNMDTEELENISAPLGTLDVLQAQTQEHMSAVSGIPLVKLLGISPHGLNASSEGELRVFYDWIHSFQEQFFADNLWKIFHFAQLNLWGEVDHDLTFEFVPLWSMTEDQIVDAMKTEAETDQVLIEAGIISPMEARRRVAQDPDAPYAGLDIEDVPDLKEEEEEGLEPKGGRPQPISELAGVDPTGVSGPPAGKEGAAKEKAEKEAPDADESGTENPQVSRREKLEYLAGDPERAEKFLKFFEEIMEGPSEPPTERMLKLARILRDKADRAEPEIFDEEGQEPGDYLDDKNDEYIRHKKLSRLLSNNNGDPSPRTRKLARLLCGPKNEPSERIQKLAALVIGPMGEPSTRIKRLAKILNNTSTERSDPINVTPKSDKTEQQSLVARGKEDDSYDYPEQDDLGSVDPYTPVVRGGGGGAHEEPDPETGDIPDKGGLVFTPVDYGGKDKASAQDAAMPRVIVSPAPIVNPTINVPEQPAPVVHVQPPVVNVQAPDVYVTTPDVKIPPAVVTVKQQPAMDAALLARTIADALKSMPTPVVNMPAPVVNVQLPKKGIERTTNVVHDEKGRIISFDRITIDEGGEEGPFDDDDLGDLDDYDNLFAEDAWRESDHPRVSSGAHGGEFTSTGGGGGGPRNWGSELHVYETGWGTPKENHARTVAKILGTPVRVGTGQSAMKYRALIAKVIREAPGFGGASAIPHLKNKMIEHLTKTHAHLIRQGKIRKAEEIAAKLRQWGVNINAPTAQPAPRTTAPPPARPQPPAVTQSRPTVPAEHMTVDKLKEAYRNPDVSDRDWQTITDHWNTHIKMTPSDFNKTMTAGLSDFSSFKLMLTRDGAVNFRSSGTNGLVVSRNINFRDKSVYHAYLNIPNSLQASGMAKKLLGSQVAFYKKIGIKEVKVSANIDIGSYAWAKYGFILANADAANSLKHKLKSKISRQFTGNEKDVFSIVGDAVTTNPKALWVIADSPKGKELLISTDNSDMSWSGKLLLDDPDCMQRFNAYINKESRGQ